MERMKKVGTVAPKAAVDVKKTRLGIGFEKLDRNVFDPEKAYDPVAAIGVKWVRIQSGWMRTEQEKGVYNFAWIDTIVENLLRRGLTPWVCLCYGNGLYDDLAAETFGGVGCLPIRTEEARQAWLAYVRAFAAHFKGRISLYEVWNEPDGNWCAKNGFTAADLGAFTDDTAVAVKSQDPDAKVIGGAFCRHHGISYVAETLQNRFGDHIDFLSYHEYNKDEHCIVERVKFLRAMLDRFCPHVGIIQGETGCPSRSDGFGALRKGAWTEEKQAKFLLRHLVTDLSCGVEFAMQFSTMDMIEALTGLVSDKATYQDYGYFGVLRADFDEDGRSVGTYSPKPSYYTLQNLASLLAEADNCTIPVTFRRNESPRLLPLGRDLGFRDLFVTGFRKEGGEALAYWYPAEILTTSYEGTISPDFYTPYEKIRLVDPMDGSIYEIPEEMITRTEYGAVSITNLPVRDYPLFLTFGDF